MKTRKLSLPNAENSLETGNAVEPGRAPSQEDNGQVLTAQLLKHEAAFAQHESAFWEALKALKAIHDGRLYRYEHSSFAEYCKKRWKFGRAHGDRLIKASEVYENLKCLPGRDIPLPHSESQVRPLTKLTHEQQSVAWKAAVKAANGGPITINLTKQAVGGLLAGAGESAGRVDAAGQGQPVTQAKVAQVKRLVQRLIVLLCQDKAQQPDAGLLQAAHDAGLSRLIAKAQSGSAKPDSSNEPRKED